MELERNLPQTLIEQLNDDTQIEVFQTWFETRGTAYFPEMTTTRLRYDKQRSGLGLGDGQQATRDAVRNYYYSTQGSIRVSPESCTWANVLDERDKAKKEWEGKDKLRMRSLLGEMDKAKEEWEGNGKFRVRSGSWMEHVPLLLDAIPTDNGLGLLKGALTVIFHAVQKRSDACERIFTCFSEIPDMIAGGHRLAELHPSKSEIASRVEELHNALFNSIPLLIDILLRQRDQASDDPSNQRRSLKRAKVKVTGVFKDLVRDPVKEVEELVTPITAAVSRLKDCATILNNEGVVVINKRVAGLEINDQLILGLVKHNAVQLDRLQSKVDELSSQQDRRAPEGVLLFVNELYRFYVESNRKRGFEASPFASEEGTDRTAQLLDHPRRESPSARKPQPAPGCLHNADINGLIEAIGTDDEHLVAHRDRDRIVRMQSEFSTNALKNAYRIMESNRLRTWISSADSELMIVDGDCLTQSKGRVSPMTVLCAAIAAGLAANAASPDPGMEPASAAVLSFACGNHASPSGLLPGPRGMMRSLISQLLIARDLPWNPKWDSKGSVSYGRHPDPSFLAESSTLWPGILDHGRTGADGHSTAGIASVNDDKKSHSSTSATLKSDSNAEYDYERGEYKSRSKPRDPGAAIAEQTHLDSLVSVFIQLVRQLDPRTTVFCILDGLSYYEPAHCGPWQPQITQVVRRLADDLWQGGGGSGKGGVGEKGEYQEGPRFKLLIASPLRLSALFSVVKSRYAGAGALCVDMTKESPHKTEAENLRIRHLGVPVTTARLRSRSGRRDGYYRGRDGGRDSRDSRDERYHSDSGGYYSGDGRGRGGGHAPARRQYRL